MLTYGTLPQFRRLVVKDSDTIAPEEETNILDVLRLATRYITKNTKRSFFPIRETRSFQIPHRRSDLAVRLYPTAEIWFDKDLLEVVTLTNGDDTTLTSTEYYLVESNIYPKFAIAPRFPAEWRMPSGAVVSSYDEAVIDVLGIWGYHNDYANAWIDTLETIPSGGITINATSFTATNVDAADENGTPRIEQGYLLKVDSEFMEVSSANTTTNAVGVVRGVNGTTAAVHTVGTPIYRWNVHEDIQDACLKIAKQTREMYGADGGRLSTGEVTGSVELVVPKTAAETVQTYYRSILR